MNRIKVTAAFMMVAMVATMQGSEVKRKNEDVSQFRNAVEPIVIGGMTGMAEVGMSGQWCTFFKNMAQSGKKVFPSIKELRSMTGKEILARAKEIVREMPRGLGINLIAMIPTTAVQATAFKALMPVVSSSETPTNSDKVKAAGIAGFVSGVVSGPTELGIVNKMVNNTSMRKLVEQQGAIVLTRGMFARCMRDGKFTIAYKGAIAPVQQALQDAGCSEKVASAVAPGMVGIITTIVTHPWDTVGTKQQVDTKKETYTSVVQTASKIIKKEGVKALFSGVKPRGVRVVAAVYGMPWAEKQLTKQVEKHT